MLLYLLLVAQEGVEVVVAHVGVERGERGQPRVEGLHRAAGDAAGHDGTRGGGGGGEGARGLHLDQSMHLIKVKLLIPLYTF